MSALQDVTYSVRQMEESRDLLRAAGEWAAGIHHHVPDEPMQRELAALVSEIYGAEQHAADISAKLRRRLDAIQAGLPRTTLGPFEDGAETAPVAAHSGGRAL